ncbi:MAG: polysaccharide deacetylase family protein [Pseudomonadota bacterium]
MSMVAYAPKSDLVTKVRRRMARYVERRPVTPNLERGIVSLSFDDCPYSVVEHALPRIEARGWKATIYASMGLCGTTNHLGLHMSEADMVAAHKSGHEIGDHTFSHIDGLQAGPDATLADINKNREEFARLDLPKAETFAYPYGEVTPSLKRALSSEFRLSRGILAPNNDTLDLNLAASGRLYSDTIEETNTLIRQAANQKQWLILFGHDVRENPSEYGCTPDELEAWLALIETLPLDVLTVKDALTQVTS